MTRSLELALLKTFCLPSISGVLQRSGEFETRPRKRYDDTGLMVAELLELNRSVEAQHFRYAASNQCIADANLAMLLDDWPAPLRPIARRLLMGLLTPPVAGSLGWSEAPSWLQRLLLLALAGPASIATTPRPATAHVFPWGSWAPRPCWLASIRSRPTRPGMGGNPPPATDVPLRLHSEWFAISE